MSSPTHKEQKDGQIRLRALSQSPINHASALAKDIRYILSRRNEACPFALMCHSPHIY